MYCAIKGAECSYADILVQDRDVVAEFFTETGRTLEQENAERIAMGASRLILGPELECSAGRSDFSHLAGKEELCGIAALACMKQNMAIRTEVQDA